MIRSTLEGRVGRILLDRPDQRNALTPEMAADLAMAVSHLAQKASCLLLEGEGRVFCAGFDLECCRRTPDNSALRSLLESLHKTLAAMRSSPVPVVIACHGAAIAGGCALLGGADYVIADRAVKLGYPVALLGISPAVSAPTLANRIGGGAARSRLLDPGLIGGHQALQAGLVSALVDSPEDVRPAAARAAERFASQPGGGIRATRDWLGKLEAAGAADRSGLEASLAVTGGEEGRGLLEQFLRSLNRRTAGR
ncbi:MAG: enoyl-CoA hydratase/isomerase family protein [Phycisphaerales bacterium]|nr:enoyl-CoA hydratase/isomerase family protein [Phycisphaerales bacterium]